MDGKNVSPVFPARVLQALALAALLAAPAAACITDGVAAHDSSVVALHDGSECPIWGCAANHNEILVPVGE
jgi:hypothetical protein